MLTRDENELITQTGPGTAMGSLFRRYWLPVALSSELPEADGAPIQLTILAEPLVAYRDTSGQVGLLDAYCPHRNANLFWGRVEGGGLRCVYHGWQFDAAGTCLEMPNEPAGSTFKDKVRATAYPTREAGGVIWAYLGPPDQQPAALPWLEWTRLPSDHVSVSKRFQRCNYLQNVEGEVDSSHVSFLHSRVDSDQYTGSSAGRFSNFNVSDRSPVFHVQETDYGLLIGARRDAGDSGYYWRITQFLMPSYTMIPAEPGVPISYTAAVPVDDSHMVGFTVTWRPDRPLSADDVRKIESWTGVHTEVDAHFQPLRNLDNRYLIDRLDQKHRSYTGIRGVREQDLAVQEDQTGPLSDRTREHLGTADLAVIALRRRLLRQVAALQEGVAPAEPNSPAAYAVRSAAIVMDRQIDWQAGARAALTADRV